MATSVGQINFGVGIDASRIAADLQRELAPALTRTQLYLDRHPLKVKVQLDGDALQRGVLRELRQVTDKDVKIKVDIDIDAAKLAALKGLGPALREARLGSDKSIKVKVDIDVDQAAAERLAAIAPALRAVRNLSDKNIKIKVDIDVDQARLEQLRAATSNLRDRKIKINSDSSSVGSAANEVTRLGSALGSLAKWTGIGGAIAAGISAVVGAAGAAAGAVGGLTFALAAIGPAVAGIGATAVVGFQGIGDTFKALKDSSEEAGKNASDQAEKIASAQDSLASAQDSLASATDSAAQAQDTLTEAQGNAADAAKGVGDAYKKAQERLDGYKQSLAEANLDEREAALNLAEARQKLAQNKFTDPLDRERAVLAVQRAEINLQKAQQAGKKLQDEANDAQAKGIDQADEVVAAKKKQAEADKQVEQAQKGVVQAGRQVEAANRQVEAAQRNLSKAQTEGAGSADKFAEALAKLSPNAQAFVLAAKDIAPSLEAARKSVQDSLFENLGNQLKETATAVLPALTDGMKGVATELNGAAQSAFEFIRSAQGIDLINNVFASSRDLIKGMKEGTGELTQGVIDLVQTATPYAESFGRGFAYIADSIGLVFTQLRQSGALDAILGSFESVLQGLGDGLNGILVGLGNVAAQVMPVLGPLFSTLGDVIEKLSPSLGRIGATFVQALTKILPPLGDVITALADGLEPVLPVLAQLINTLAEAITPLIPVFSEIAVTLGQTLVDTIKALEPALVPLAQAFSDLLTAVAPLVPLIAENLAVAVQALAPALSVVFQALAPVIKQFAEQMMPVVQQLAPVLAQVAMTIGMALANAITEIAPMLPDLVTAFTNLVLAIAPLLPQIVDLAVQFLPPLIDTMKILIPIITEAMNAFAWFANEIIGKILVPALQWLNEQWTGINQNISDGIDWLVNNVFPKLGEAVGKVRGWFDDAVKNIREIWGGLRDAARDPVNFVIETVWNNGLLKAWKSIDDLLGGILPDATPIAPIPARAMGGPVGYTHGPGNGTKDDLLTWLSNGEHVITAAEVVRAGGQDVLYAIRDMIYRGVPFTWDNGKIITDLGLKNLQAYGSQVAMKGLGNVPPEGLFDQLAKGPVAQFATGGAIMPWMLQLQKGHEFARAQSGKPYQWAGPRFVGDSFDCSGFMASVTAAILGDNPWQRYWATSSFAGYPNVGPQGYVKNLMDGVGMVIGVTDDPGGPGGGHTAGELRGIPELGIAPARIESGGSLGDVHYGAGTPVNTFDAMYGLPIGANGFFQPSTGGGTNGPSVASQKSFLSKTIEKMVHAATDPLRETIKTVIGDPPPMYKALPPALLTATEKGVTDFATSKVGDLGGLIGGAWQKAQNLGSRLLDSLNPFDSGGVATGTGFLAKNVIEPERVLSPEQTKLFEALVAALSKMAATSFGALGQSVGNVVVDISQASVEALKVNAAEQRAEDQKQTADAIERTASSQEAVAAQAAREQMDMLLSIAGKLSGDVLGPVLSSAVNAGIGILNDWIDGLSKDLTQHIDGTTAAVNNLGNDLQTSPNGTPAAPPFGAPGSAFDLAQSVSDAVVSVAKTAEAAFNKVAQDVVNAALAQTPSKVGNQSKGKLGAEDISGGYLVDLIVRLTGVDIEILDLLENTYKEIQSFREGAFTGFDENGQLISDTAAMVQRTATSMELAQHESERIQKALIKAVLKYLITSVLIPIITAVLGAMITLASTAIGAAIGSAIPIIGTAIGAAIGAAVGAALSGLAAVFTSLLAVGAGAALDAFDEGGVASGLGYMPKNTIAPERVLSPRQTTAFEQLVGVLDRGTSGNRTIQIGSMNVNGRDPAQKTADNLLALLNT